MQYSVQKLLKVNCCILNPFRNIYYSLSVLGFQNETNIQSKTKLLREEFQKLEIEYENKVKDIELTEEEFLIYSLHKKAVKNGHFTYDDPETGSKVMTRLRHFFRRSCCGNACRHCIYNHENVPVEVKKRRVFNGAFWVDKKPENLEEEIKTVSLPPPYVEKTAEDIFIEKTDPFLFKH